MPGVFKADIGTFQVVYGRTKSVLDSRGTRGESCMGFGGFKDVPGLF